MATIPEALAALDNRRNELADSLVSAGVSAQRTETLATLIPKVLDIEGSAPNVAIEIICTETLPEDVTDNTIVVITPSGSPAVLSETVPQMPIADGLVWIGYKFADEVYIGNDGAPAMKLMYAQIYQGGDWTVLDAYHSYFREWIQFSIIGTPLGDKSIGSIVSFKVNGVLKDFIVVHQGKPSSIYDDSFNGGTILLMKDLYESRQWHSSNVNDYAKSTIHSYLNNAFLNLIDPKIREHIKQVKIPYRAGSGTSKTISSGANGLPADVYLLSCLELGWKTSDNSYLPADGAALSYFAGLASRDEKRIAYLGGVAIIWWLRTPLTSAATNAWHVRHLGDYGYDTCSVSSGIRPALVLPSSLMVSDTGEIITN